MPALFSKLIKLNKIMADPVKEKTVKVRLLQNISGSAIGDIVEYSEEFLKRLKEGVDYSKDLEDKKK